LGLLGTVTGMIQVFDVLALEGNNHPRAMANGISMATIPTMAGMVVALFGLFFSSRLQQRAGAERQRAAEMLRNAGATAVHRANWPSILLHIHSSMRMGLDPANSVLDDGAEAREVPGLFIADNSALANGIGGPNPTLTSQAVATRTAEKIFGRYFGGDPWVATESPVSSIDRSVTDAVVELGL
jgi:choline dehydrogenase-like flavoprotein